MEPGDPEDQFVNVEYYEELRLGLIREEAPEPDSLDKFVFFFSFILLFASLLILIIWT